MKNKFMQTAFGTLLGLVMLIGGAQIFVSGQRGGFVAQERRIVGVFQTTVTQLNCQTGNPTGTFRGLLTFNEGGTLAETSTALPPALRTPGHGVWKREPGFQEYSFTFTFYRFNPDGTFAGTTIVRQNLTLAPGGNEFDSTGFVQAFNAAGVQLGTGGCSTSVGTRFD